MPDWLTLLVAEPTVTLGMYLRHRITLRMERKRFMQVLYGVLMLTGSSLIIRSAQGA